MGGTRPEPVGWVAQVTAARVISSLTCSSIGLGVVGYREKESDLRAAG
jgi:hypothetical protein